VTLGDVRQDEPGMHRTIVSVYHGDEATLRVALTLEDDEPLPARNEYVANVLRQVVSVDMDARLAVIRDGFTSLIPLGPLQSTATVDVLQRLVYGAPEISVDDLMAHTSYPGELFTAASPQIQWMWSWLRRSDNDVRRKFLNFVTGLSQLPVEGMAGLGMRLVIARSYHADLGARSHTCSFQLELPVYSSPAQLEEYMLAAISSDGFGML
jgi:hypothetical protein